MANVTFFVECMQDGFSHWNVQASCSDEAYAIRTAQSKACKGYRYRVRDSNNNVRFIV